MTDAIEREIEKRLTEIKFPITKDTKRMLCDWLSTDGSSLLVVHRGPDTHVGVIFHPDNEEG